MSILGCPDCREASRVAILNPAYSLDALQQDPLPNAPGRPREYHRLLPVPHAAAVVTLGEGGTPLLPLVRVEAETGTARVWMKYEAVNSTHLFKQKASSLSPRMSRRTSSTRPSARMPWRSSFFATCRVGRAFGACPLLTQRRVLKTRHNCAGPNDVCEPESGVKHD